MGATGTAPTSTASNSQDSKSRDQSQLILNGHTLGVNNLSFSYKKPKVTAFTNLSVSFEEATTTALLGHNGAGKTTLLKLMYGTLKPTTGVAWISSSIAQDYRDIFLLSDNYGINPSISLMENIKFHAKLRGRNFDRVINHPIFDLCQLRKRMDRPPSTLSSGQRKRADFAVGISLEPTLIMLDEPTNSVDPATREMIKSVILELKSDLRTIILVTHDLDFAYNLADRSITLDDGSIVRNEPRAAYGSQEHFLETYLHYTEGQEIRNYLEDGNELHKDE